MTFSTLRTIVIKFWAWLTNESCRVYCESRKTAQTFCWFITYFTILYTLFAFKGSPIKIISDDAPCAIGSSDWTCWTRINAFWTWICVRKKHPLFAVITNSCLIAWYTVRIRTSHTTPTWGPVSYFALTTIVIGLTYQTISWTL